MSLDLLDIGIKRLKVTAETAAWLEWQVRQHPTKSKQEIVRDALHAMAIDEIHAARLLAALSPAEGRPGNGGAASGNIGANRLDRAAVG